MLCKRFWLVGLLLSVLFPAVRAQIPLGPTVNIGPVTAGCTDPLGNTVLNYVSPTPLGAQAVALYGRPAIILNVAVLSTFPTQFQVFTYIHECGHHFNGDVLGMYGHMSEFNADCYAAKITRNFGWLNPADFGVAMSVLKTFLPDATHPPGPARVANAENCYNTP